MEVYKAGKEKKVSGRMERKVEWKVEEKEEESGNGRMHRRRMDGGDEWKGDQ